MESNSQPRAIIVSATLLLFACSLALPLTAFADLGSYDIPLLTEPGESIVYKNPSLYNSSTLADCLSALAVLTNDLNNPPTPGSGETPGVYERLVEQHIEELRNCERQLGSPAPSVP